MVVGMIAGVVAWQQRVLIKDWALGTPAVPVAVTYEGIAESQNTPNKNEELGITENAENKSEDTEKIVERQ